MSTEKLVTIPPNDWPALRDLFLPNWPHNLVGFYTVQNFIRWHEQEPKLHLNTCTLLSVNDDWKASGAFAVIVEKSLFFFCLESGANSMLKILCLLDYSKVEVSYLCLARFREVLMKLAKIKGLKLIYKSQSEYIRITKEDFTHQKGLTFEPKVDGITFKPISITKLEHLEKAVNAWPWRYPSSLKIFQLMAQYNLSLGAFDEKGELLAWCFQYPNGCLTALQTVDEHKRKGLAFTILNVLCFKLIAELDQDVYATMVPGNESLTHILKKCGIKTLGEKAYYIWIEQEKREMPSHKL